MNAPFRELFVELPRAVFEVLQGIGERAAIDGHVALLRDLYPPHREPRIVSFLRSETARRLLAERHGWSEIGEPIHTASDATFRLMVTRMCGHRTRVWLDQVALEALQPRAALDHVDRVFMWYDEREQRCYCVPRHRP